MTDYLLSPDFKSHLENGYFLAGILLALGLVFSAFQLMWFRGDTRTRNERAAAEKAIEYASRYLSSFVQLDGTFTQNCETEKLPSYKGVVRDFRDGELNEEEKKIALKRWGLTSWLPAMNELLTIAAAYTSGVADEKVGFNIIGRTYCASVASHYDLLCMARDDAPCAYFQPIIDLYRIWAARLTASELRQARKDLDEQLGAIRTPGIPPIGTT